MKRILITLAVLAIAATSFAQQRNYQPVPFPAENSFWCERYDSVWNEQYVRVRHAFLLNGEDTLILGRQFKKLFFSPSGDTLNYSYLGGVFEDSLRRVWFYGTGVPHNDFYPLSGTEKYILLYDFSVEVGDELSVGSGYLQNFDNLTVERVDTVGIGGVLRKRISFENMDFEWIEGIGSTRGLLYFGQEQPLCICPNNDLLCFIQNDSLIYHWSNWDCFPTNTIKTPGTSAIITVYPNPAKDRITLAFGEARFSTLRLVNTAGATVLEATLTGDESQHTLLLTGLPAGIYSCILSGKDGTATEKIVVE